MTFARSVPLLLTFVIGSLPSPAHAQADCSVPYIPNWPNPGDKVAFIGDVSDFGRVQHGVGLWTGQCTELPMPTFAYGGEAQHYLFSGYQVWNIVENSPPAPGEQDYCAQADPATQTIRFKTTADSCTKTTMAHEIGHVLGLDNVGDTDNPAPECGPGTDTPGSIMWVGTPREPRAVTIQTCTSLKEAWDHFDKRDKEKEPEPELEPDPCAADPDPSCPNYCYANPDDPDCFCILNPFHELCGGEIEVCCPPTELVLVPQCREFPYTGLSGEGVVSVTGISSRYEYTVSLSRRANVGIELSEMSRDFSCSVTAGGGEPDRGGPAGASNSATACATDDTWSGVLDAGDHTIAVWPTESGAGNHKLTVTATNVRPETTTRVVVKASETDISTKQEYRFYLKAESSVTVKLADLTQDFDCTINGGGHTCTNNLGTLDDSWSGTLPDGSYTVQVEPFVGAEPGNYTLTVTAEPPPMPDTEDGDGEDDDEDSDPDESDPDAPTPPAAVSLAGSVANQTHSLSWTEPSSSSEIMGYRVETRTSTADWFVPTGGSPSPSSALPATTRSWSISVPAESVRHYRVRASSSAGDGDWSNVVILTAEPSPPAAPVLNGSATSTSQRLTWSAPTSTRPITGYEMMLRESSSHSWRHTGAGSPTPSSAFPASALAWNLTNSPGLYREYRLRAKSSAGNSNWSNVVTLRSEPPPASPPSAPTIVGVAGVGSHSVSWTTPDSDEAITRYQMAVRESSSHSWRWTNAGSPSGSSNFPPTTQSWTLSASAGLYREYKLRATSSAGDGEWSNIVSLRALAPPPPDPEPPAPPPAPPPAAPPGAPSLSGLLLGKQTHTLSWTAASSTIPVTRYQMQTRNSSRHGWRYTTAGTPSPSSKFGATVRSWQVTTPPGLHRQYRVRARNDSGYGAWSNVVSLTSQGGGASGAADDDSTDDDGDGDDDGYECEDDDEDC